MRTREEWIMLTRMLRRVLCPLAGSAVLVVVAVLAVAGTPLATVARADRGGTDGARALPAVESVSAHTGGTLTLAVANQPGAYTDPLPQAFDPASQYGTLELTIITNDG